MCKNLSKSEPAYETIYKTRDYCNCHTTQCTTKFSGTFKESREGLILHQNIEKLKMHAVRLNVKNHATVQTRTAVSEKLVQNNKILNLLIATLGTER